MAIARGTYTVRRTLSAGTTLRLKANPERVAVSISQSGLQSGNLVIATTPGDVTNGNGIMSSTSVFNGVNDIIGNKTLHMSVGTHYGAVMEELYVYCSQGSSIVTEYLMTPEMSAAVKAEERRLLGNQK